MAEPRNPLAGKAGPGKFSVREDLPPSKEYGERKQMQEMISGAPTAPSGAAAQSVSSAGLPITPLTAPTERPDVPLTSGMDIGEGPGSEILPNFRQSEADIVSKYMPALNALASQAEAPQSFRLFVRYLQGNM
jgi:hypothetical protein